MHHVRHPEQCPSTADLLAITEHRRRIIEQSHVRKLPVEGSIARICVQLIGTGSSSPASHCFDLAARGVGARRHAAISGRSIGALDFSRQLSFAFRVKATGLRRHSCAGPLSQSQPGGEEWILETIANRSDRFLLAYDATRIQGFERLVHRRRGNSVA